MDGLLKRRSHLQDKPDQPHCHTLRLRQSCDAGFKAHNRWKERFLTGRNRTKRTICRGSPLFQATYNRKTEKQTIKSTCLVSVRCGRLAEGKSHETDCNETQVSPSMEKSPQGGDLKEDNFQCLGRSQQVVIFRLRTGLCRLLSHLYRLNLSHANECPCGTSSQTPEHVLQNWPTDRDVWRQTWPEELELQEKLWESVASLRKTADFIRTGLTIWARSGNAEEDDALSWSAAALRKTADFILKIGLKIWAWLGKQEVEEKGTAWHQFLRLWYN